MASVIQLLSKADPDPDPDPDTDTDTDTQTHTQSQQGFTAQVTNHDKNWERWTGMSQQCVRFI